MRTEIPKNNSDFDYEKIIGEFIDMLKNRAEICCPLILRGVTHGETAGKIPIWIYSVFSVK